MKHSAPVPVQAWTGEVGISSGRLQLEGTLAIPEHARGLVLFAHGSGSSRHSPRNRHVAETLQKAGLATLLFDLLTKDEEAADEVTGHLRFDIDLLASRLWVAAGWAARDRRSAGLRIGYFGSSTGAAAALVAAADEGADIGGVVSRGGRPDLAGDALARVRAPTLLIVGGEDDAVIPLNEEALARLRCEKRLEIVPGATHLFEEPGTLDQAAGFAAYREKPRPSIDVPDRIAIMVDDGLATGSTMRAAVEANRQRRPRRLIVAVPVGARDTCTELARDVDALICPLQPDMLGAIGAWYDDFAETTDDEVRQCLAAATRNESAARVR